MNPNQQPQQPADDQDPFAALVQGLAWAMVPPDDHAALDAAAADAGAFELETPKDDDALDRLLRDWFGMKLPNTRCCQGHQTPWEAFHDAYFARSVMAIWKASRGLGGKSHTLAALGTMEALTLRADVNILGGSGEQSRRILESMKKLWESTTAPTKALLGDPGGQKQRFRWGNSITALMASQTSVRGPHPQRLRLDEIDEMKWAILNAALGQPMSKGWITSHVVGSSTHQYPDGTMTKMLKRAAEEPGIAIFEWCYLENLEPRGWLSLGEVERKRALLTKEAWQTEIELQEPSAEGRAMDTEKVQESFSEAIQLEPYDPGDPKTNRPAGKYVTGADWAKKKNWTVIVTIRTDVKPMRVVAITRVQKKPWPDMVTQFDDQVKAYGNQRRNMHDNTGLGQVITDLIGVQSEPFDMVGRQRKELLSEYVAAVEKGDLLWPRTSDDPETKKALDAAFSEHKYCTREDLYNGSKDGSGRWHLPDSISAAAFAWRQADTAEPASASSDPDPGDTPHLNEGMMPGRMSGHVFGGDMSDQRPVGLGKWRRPGPGGRVVVDGSE